MNKLTIIALAAGVLTASCAGHGSQSAIPTLPGAQHSGGNARTASSIVAPAGWASTATFGASIAQATDAGALTSTKTLTVRVGLQMHNASQLAQLIARGTIVPHGQFMSQFAPTAGEASSVVSYLQSQGLTNITTEPNNLLISANGSAAQIEKAFNTSLEAFTLGGQSLFANTSPAFVPQSLGSIVVAVLGLNNASHVASSPTDCFPANPPPSGAPCVRSYDAHAIQTVYDAGSTPTGSLTTIAVMAEGNVSQTVSDLRLAESTQGLPQVPVTVVKVGLSSSDTSGLGEWDLDTQSSTGIAGNVKQLYIYDTTSLQDSDIANEYSHWVTQDVAQLGNSSFGECEYQAWLDGAMKVDDQLFMQAASQGQTMFASSGDTGSSCALVGTNGAPGSGPPLVEYPAASPYAMAVGGTTLLSNTDETYAGEVSWNAGGGGLSQFENSTSWEQQGQLVGGSAAEANLRGVPDIAMAADPNSGGYLLYANPEIQTATGPCTNPCGIGGTSEASPLSMGVYARMLSAHTGLGFAPPQYYQVYLRNFSLTNVNPTGTPPTQIVGGFHDILTGVNGAYSAAPGYDYTTGLGSVDISLMNSQL